MTTITAGRQAFTLEGKALGAVARADGDLILEGWAARFDVDREGEAFEPGAFERSAKAFLEGTAALVFHHQKAKILGRVLSLEEKPGGIWMRAVVDGAIRHDPVLRTLYAQIKSGSIRGASVGGFFQRRNTPAGTRITAVDLTEISLTGTPIGGHGTVVRVVEGKALDASPVSAELAVLLADIDALRRMVYRDQVADLFISA